jgi:hypothetical protein
MALYYICTHTGYTGEGKPVQSGGQKPFTSFEDADKAKSIVSCTPFFKRVKPRSTR